MMDVVMRDNHQRSRHELRVDGDLAGVVDYRVGAGQVDLVHTEVDASFAGRGLGTTLVEFALRDARARGLKVVPSCPFVSVVIARKPEEFLDLVPEERRGEFGLG
ncbi:MAG: N-acetyltransferase [Acidobacteriota bacterium]|nr:GNAT family N-acetyltransferase [Acidobacteriota bacterium]MDE3139054.1 N-acetyltransferase [Acidobacteriota bacterium]